MVVPQLWKALLSGQYDLAKQMIYNGANVNETAKTKSNNVITLLHKAVELSNARCIRMLAKLGADFNARDSWYRTPLHWAAACGVGPYIVEVLINNGALVDARDHNQMTPLHHAAIDCNSVKSAKKLIARGASLEARGDRGDSILHMAVWYRNLEMVRMLISYRVNIDPKDNRGRTPLRLYFFTHWEGEDKIEIPQLLLDNGADVNSKSPNTGTFSLFWAAHFNRLDSVNLLLTRGARVNEATNTGDTALYVACENELPDVAALLLKFGADLNVHNQEGNTPFQLLAHSPTCEVTAQIIIREAVKREAFGQFLCEGYKLKVQSCETYSRFDQECREEITRMQSEKIDAEDSAISFFYIFSIDEDKLVALARNESIVTAFESSGYAASFRIYAGELKTKFEIAKKRANLPAPIVRKLAAYVKYGYIIGNEL